MSEANPQNERQDLPDDEKLRTNDFDAEDTPIGRMMLDRSEVRDIEVNMGHQCVIINVLFETWSIPTDFGAQYDMRLHSAAIVDDRPRWKRVLGIGRRKWIQGRYVRDTRQLGYSEE